MPRTTLPRLAEPPSVHEALAMERTLEATVEPRFIDAMGHMNVSFYVQLFDRGTWELFRRLGMDERYVRDTQHGAFAVEQHIRYLGELRAGDAVEIHTRILDAGPRSLTILHVMVDVGRRRVAAMMEVVGVHMDLRTRKSAPLAEPLVAALRGRLPPPGT
jgi:acyl-CoA thioester hydrolase